MSDEKISQLPPAGALNGSDIFPIVRGGSNFGAAIANIPSTGGGPLPTVSLGSNYNVLATDDGTYFDNGMAAGPIAATLPAPSPGLRYNFAVTVAQSFQVAVPAGVEIALGASSSPTGLTASLPFSSIFVYAPLGAANRWVVTGIIGGWGVD